MRQLIVTEFISLDGVIQDPGGGEHPRAGWTFKEVDFLPEAYEIKGVEQSEASALLLGRVSFEEFAPVWPSMEEFTQYNAMPKYVVTRSLDEASVIGAGWENCHKLSSVEEVAELKKGEGGPILVHGSARLAQSLAAAGLVDRYHLMVFPVLLGSGKRLFSEDEAPAGSLRLASSTSYENGIVLNIYDVGPAQDFLLGEGTEVDE